MNKILVFLALMLLVSCSDTGDNGSVDSVTDQDLTIGVGNGDISKRVKGTISSKNEVDVYTLNIVESNRELQIRCASSVPDVDYLVHVFEQSDEGKLTMIAGSHARENGMVPPEILIRIFIEKPKKLVVHVRDLKGDDISNNPYYLSADYGLAPDGNESFDNAIHLNNDNQYSARDSIGKTGDVDCFGFTVENSGVYNINVLFEPMTGTEVNLAVELFEKSTGMSLEAGPRNMRSSENTDMIHCLKAADYIVRIKDEGDNDFDNSSFYTVTVSPSDVSEVLENDTPERAESIIGNSFINTAVGYYEDQDWYRVDLQPGGDLQLLEFTFKSDFLIPFQMNLYRLDPSAGGDLPDPIYSHSYRSSIDSIYGVVLKLAPLELGENYYMCITPLRKQEVYAAASYTISAEVLNINDPDETGTGNNSDANPVQLIGDTSGDHTGKISYRGDKDWYRLPLLTSSQDRVLSFYLDIPKSPDVEYAMDIKTDTPAEGGLVKKVFHGSDDQRAVALKTSFIVTRETDVPTYLIKVYDNQNDDGEDKSYTLSWSIEDVPTAVPVGKILSDPEITALIYHDESSEQRASEPTTVTIDYTDGKKGLFNVNTDALSMSGSKVEKSEYADNKMTITFPWVAGYIDCQDDEDWFGLDLSTPIQEGVDTWYYKINVEMNAENSEVEYTWEYYPDSNNDGNVHIKRCSKTSRQCSGVLACQGDLTTDKKPVCTDFPTSSENFLWQGSGDERADWKGMVYFRISDFNYFFINTQDVPNPNPDNDWSYDAPYFFRVTLEFFGGESHPPETGN